MKDGKQLILVADDEQEIRDIIPLLLRGLGCYISSVGMYITGIIPVLFYCIKIYYIYQRIIASKNIEKRRFEI